jgi:Protein of unknown function (DUF1579)
VPRLEETTMKLTRRFAVSLVALTMISAQAVEAADTPPPSPPQGPPELPKPAALLSHLADFEGTWKCAGTRRAMPNLPPYPIQTTWKGKRDLNGFWVTIRLEEKKTAQNPMPVSGNYTLGFDPANAKLLALWNDSAGGRSEQLSSGWEGDSLTWLGEYNLGGQKVQVRGVFHKKGPKEMAHTGEANLGGQWVVLVEETCKR